MRQSVLLPFAMLPVLHFSNSAGVMGRFAGSRRGRFATVVFAITVCAINLLVVVPYLTRPGCYRAYWQLGALLYVGARARACERERGGGGGGGGGIGGGTDIEA